MPGYLTVKLESSLTENKRREEHIIVSLSTDPSIQRTRTKSSQKPKDTRN